MPTLSPRPTRTFASPPKLGKASQPSATARGSISWRIIVIFVCGLTWYSFREEIWSLTTPTSGTMASMPSSAARVSVSTAEVPELRQSSAGLLHPIPTLIREGKAAWEAKLARQSTSLHQAVAEYKRRYGRNPPKNFDIWHTFAVERGVKLIDEYDQINRDIEEFLALPPEVIHKRSAAMISDANIHWHKGSFTLRIANGAVAERLGPEENRASNRVTEQIRLLENFARWLPDMNISYWKHDGPAVSTAGESKQNFRELARANKLVQPVDWDKSHHNAELVGWERMCPPGSLLRNYFSSIETLPETSRPSFITNHLEAVDFCRNPLMLHQHSTTLRAGNGPPAELHWPIFAHSKTTMYSDLLIIPLSQYSSSTSRRIAWADKKHSKLLWRGSTTGIRNDRSLLWRFSQRHRLLSFANNQKGQRNILLSDENDLQKQLNQVSHAAVNDELFDVAFAGQPVQCSEADGTCAAMRKNYRFSGRMGADEALEYKYVLDVDGNAWSGRFHRLFSSGSLVLKSTAFVEWWMDRIQPWVHYIPVKIDYSDLHDIMTFFVGYRGLHAHDAVAGEIAAAGTAWAEQHWRFADMETYMFRLYLEYARVLDRHFEYTE